MKKLIVLLVVLLTLAGCNSKKDETIDIESKITLNSSKADMSDYVYFSDTDHVYEIVSIKESNRMYTEKGSGILYYGYSQCPYCNRIVSALNDAGKETGVKIYYIDLYGEDYADEDINNLFTNLDPILEKDSSGEAAFYVPEVVAIKDGEIINHHLSVVDSYEDVTKNLTDSQYKELKDIYVSMIKELK
ncbi:MAG: lipoprotein [Erysipelotrichaceae bacterium]|nr:lipoprotein [Erysipelotrichaceae bacterium]